MQNVHAEHMSLVRSFIEASENAKYEVSKDLLEALKSSGTSGELNLPSMNLNVWSWQTIVKLIPGSSIRSLNISNCLIPTRGLATLCTALSQGGTVEHLDLRGNNVQEESVSHVGKMLRYNVSLKRISLEWNCIGLNLEFFTIFCDGLAANQTLEVLDLRNNQLNADCSPALANALIKNTSIRHIDLRWNNLGWKGGNKLYSVFQTNQSIIKMKLQGNCIPTELTMAIEQCVSHNATRAALLAECAQRTELLAQRLRQAETERLQELQRLNQHSEEQVQQLVLTNENRIIQLEKQLHEKEECIASLKKQVLTYAEECRKSQETTSQLQSVLKERESMFKQVMSMSKKEVEELRKAASAKSDEMNAMQTRLETQIHAEQQRFEALKASHAHQADDIRRLQNDLQTTKERSAATVKQLEEKVAKQKAAYEELLDEEARESHKRKSARQQELETQRSTLETRVAHLERMLEEKERLREELSSALALERDLREKEIRLAQEDAVIKEAERNSQLDERLSGMKSEHEKVNAQLAQTQAQLQELQHKHTALCAEAVDAQRRIAQLQEELASEKSNAQQIQKELTEEKEKLQRKIQMTEKLQEEVDDLHKQVANLLKSHDDIKRERQNERDHLDSLMKQRDREIENIRAQEVERANNLYSAFSKYLSSVSPSTSKLHSPQS